MGCGEGNLERKARRFGWKEAAGGLVFLAFGTGVGFLTHHLGYEKAKKEDAAAAEEIKFEADSSARSVTFTNGLYSVTGGDCGYFIESLFVDQPEGRYFIVDGDGLMQAPSGGFYPMFHDREVDFIDTPGGDRLVRPKNYEMHRDLFDRADEWMRQGNHSLE